MSVKDTSMMIFKWVPVAEDEQVAPKKTGFNRAQANVLAPTGGSILTMSSRPPELRTETPIANESAPPSKIPKLDPSVDSSKHCILMIFENVSMLFQP